MVLVQMASSMPTSVWQSAPRWQWCPRSQTQTASAPRRPPAAQTTTKLLRRLGASAPATSCQCVDLVSNSDWHPNIHKPSCAAANHRSVACASMSNAVLRHCGRLPITADAAATLELNCAVQSIPFHPVVNTRPNAGCMCCWPPFCRWEEVQQQVPGRVCQGDSGAAAARQRRQVPSGRLRQHKQQAPAEPARW